MRRTRNLLLTFGYSATGDDIVLRLASDLSDRIVDGRGGFRTDSRTAAISKVVAAQVLLESMSNELHVNGVDATNAMKSAIEQVSSSTPQITIDNLLVTSEMLLAARTGLTAALAVSESTKLTLLDQAVNGLQPGMEHQLVQTLLPPDYRATLDDVIMIVAGGDAAVIAKVNNVNGPDETASPNNRAPSIQGVPPTSARIGLLYSFDANASDPDGDSLTFGITRLPAWMSFNESTGELTGTPSANDIATYSDIVISVTDGEFSSSLPAFSITVTNSPPVISGTAASTVTANGGYSFTPTASDADNDTLTFSVSGLPGWASFNTATGRISGTPDDADVGVYSDITITVSDGRSSASLGPFSITVNVMGADSVTLSWTAPTQNEDGSTLLNLAGYRVYWGTASGIYPNSVTINNSGLTTYVVENLDSGTYEFVATSLNADGVESEYSNLAVKTVP